MIKTVAVLTKSDKNSNFCVAGINVENGEWIRLENKNLKGCAISQKDLRYSDGSYCKELDVVEVECLEEDAALLYQPENVYIKNGVPFRKINEMTWRDVISIWDLDAPKPAILNSFYDRCSIEYIKNLKEHKSLQLVKVRNINFEESQCDENKRYKHAKVSFEYTSSLNKNILYRLTVTDSEYFPQIEKRHLEEAYMIISRGGEFNGYYYSLVAKIIEDLDEPFFVTTSCNTGKRYFHRDCNCKLLQYIGQDKAVKYSMNKIRVENVEECKQCKQDKIKQFV